MNDAAVVTVEGSRATYRMSAAGMCGRCLAAVRAGFEPIAPRAEMQRRFDDGHLHESSIIRAVEEEMGVEVIGQQKMVVIELTSRVMLVGHIDGMVREANEGVEVVPVEVKSASEKQFRIWKRGIGSWFKTHPSYADQFVLYCIALESLGGYYAVKDKNSGEVLTRFVELDGAIFPTYKSIARRVLQIDLWGRTGKIPDHCDRNCYAVCPVPYIHDNGREGTDGEEVIPLQGDDVLAALAASYEAGREMEKRGAELKREAGEKINRSLGVEVDGDGRIVKGEKKAVAGSWGITVVEWSRSIVDTKAAGKVYDLDPYTTVRRGVYPMVKELGGGEAK